MTLVVSCVTAASAVTSIHMDTRFRDKQTRTNTLTHLYVENYPNDWHSYVHTAGVQGDSHAHSHLLSIAIDCDVITHFSPSAALPLALLWPWSILFEVIIASTLQPTMENEIVREWLWRMWWPQPPCLHSLTTTHTFTHWHARTHILLDYHDCPCTLLCCPSALCPLPALSLSCLQSSKQALGLYGRQVHCI